MKKKASLLALSDKNFNHQLSILCRSVRGDPDFHIKHLEGTIPNEGVVLDHEASELDKGFHVVYSFHNLMEVSPQNRGANKCLSKGQ